MKSQQISAKRGKVRTVRISLLGGFRVAVGSREVPANEWRLRKAAGLVKILALAPGHRLHRERVMDLLWPDLDARSAANNLHRALHAARHALEPHGPAAGSGYLRIVEEQVELCGENPLWVDAEVFEEAATAARHAREPDAYGAAADLYAGELLPGDLYEAWAEERRESLRRTYLSLLLEKARLHEERGEPGPAIRVLRELVDEDRANEDAHVGLVRLYAQSKHRNEALRQYEWLREDLRRELAREPSVASQRLYEEIMAGRYTPAHPAGERANENGHHRNNLPLAQSSFVGRKRETLEVKRTLAMTGLLTLTGAGGCGKTRLALEVARDLVGAYPDGVWLVELASISEEALVPNAVAGTLGARERPDLSLTDTLVDHVGSGEMLLVLDNCEHLIDATARLVDTLLRSCGNLRVLATSREPLGVAGEINWLVPSLTVPGGEDRPATENLLQYEAVQLFLERARSRLPTFVLTSETAPAVVDVCRRVDGIPLAIELATARMTVLEVEQIAERLGDSLGLLTTGNRTAAPRQRTLRATLAWSYDLLGEPERALFERLSVFAGGLSLEAAEAVCSGGGIVEEHVLDLLGRLVDKSLVVAEAGEDGALRYRMLEPIRQYGRERLARSDEEERVRERHVRYYLAFAERAEPELLGAGQAEWLRRLRIELGNLRAALAWSAESGREEGARLRLRLAAAMWRFWDLDGFEEGKRWLHAALDSDPGGSPAVRAKALGGLGWILLFQQDYERAIAVLDEAIALYGELGDDSGAALALGHLGYAMLHGGYRERVPAFVREAEALLQVDLDESARAYLRIIVATATMVEGDVDSAVSQLEINLGLCRGLGDLRNTSMSLFILGNIELHRGAFDRGAAMLEEGAGIARELGDRLGGAYFALGLGKVNALRGRQVRAARLWGAAEALRERMGISLSRFDLAASGYERDLAGVRSSLSEAAFDAAWAEGRAMTPEQAIDYALSPDEPAAPPVVPLPEESRPVLSRRQREVALLIARGLTNRQIAEELSISERTVTTHVDHILTRLGASSRTQVAAWMVGQTTPTRGVTG